MPNSIFAFQDGDKSMKDVLGGKGANLAEMTRLGLPVPPGFTITTETCAHYLDKSDYPKSFSVELDEHLKTLEKRLERGFGDDGNPLLVSVRSGAAVSMPGMMDTILNLGLNDKTVVGLINKTKNERFSYDSYRRFVQMFGNVVLGVKHDLFEGLLEKVKEKKGVEGDQDLEAADFQDLVVAYKKLVKEKTGREFPEDPNEQLELAISAVFNSWNNDRAVTYRRINEISGLKGTAVTVQAMVFGNMGETSGTGVAFTRNPSNGENEFYGEFLLNAQGEDVVAGIRTPHKLVEMRDVMPGVYDQLEKVRVKLEDHYRDMQDIEFTIQEGELFVLQTRAGKRTAPAALKIAVDMVEEELLTKEQAIMLIEPKRLNQMLHPDLDPEAPKNIVAKGLPASPGAATGKVVFTADDAYDWMYNRDERVILVRKETSPEDIHGMHLAQGILTSTGGMTSHAAVVCRGMGKSCVAGCSDIQVDVHKKEFRVGDVVVKEGDFITLDGTTGEVMLGRVPMITPEITPAFDKVLTWCNEIKRLVVRTNADTPKDAKVGRKFGGEGIGLCRTEHMFFSDDRIKAVRKMILSKSEDSRRKALESILPMQKEDFIGLFEAMDGLPVTVRLLDPPLHEFMPQNDEQIEELAEDMELETEDLKRIIVQMEEVNPMLGHRGSRLGITNPEIYEMQVKAIIEAAIEVAARGITVIPEIELPFISDENELQAGREMVQKTVDHYKKDISFEYRIGSMIELPRACLTADELAEHADFFSFGTNDLTQTTWGYSRDDSGKFLNHYLENGVLEKDPMETIDQKAVGHLMETCVKLGKKKKKNIEIGICGEQAGEPLSVDFCHRIGLDYVSCSPYRVPIARISAAQAAIKNGD